MQFSWKRPLKALPVLLLLAAYAGAALSAAGNVQFVIGDVKLITRTGETRTLQKGAEINEGDRIVTAAGASAQLKMADGGFIAVRPNTNMSFDTYRFSGKEDGKESAVVSLLQGGFRTITGLIGHTNKQNYLIRTETATIGIRGTDHEPMVILPPAPGQATIAPPGTYDKVNVGVAFIRTDAGSVDIQRNQVGFAPITKAAPTILPRIPPFYKPTPAPGPQKAKEEAKDEGKKESAAAAPAKAGEEQKAAAPAEKAAEAPAAAPATEKAAEVSAATRSTAVVDPTTVVATAPAAAPVAAAPAPIAPVIAVTATSASNATLNTTNQTVTTSSGTQVPVAQTTTTSSGTIVPVTQVPIISSPVVAVSNYGFGVIASIPVTGGVDLVSFGSPTVSSNTANTNFVLSDKHLVEILQSPYERFGITTTPTMIANANIKFSGGTAADTFSDPNGTYYMGRWSGGQIAVTDLATTGTVAPFADSLGTSSLHWVIGLTPGNVAGTSINNVQQLIGKASYALAAATHPTDGFGNVGTLNSATLTADFSGQTLDSNLNLSFSSADPVSLSKRNLNLAAAATKMPIQKTGFGGAVIAPTVAGVTGIVGTNNTVTCSGADCAAGGYVGAISGAFLATASGGSTSGAVGTGVGLNYGFTAIPTSTSTTTQPFADFITGAAVLSASAAPTAGTTAVAVTGGTGTYRQQIVLPLTIGTTTYNANYNLASGTTTNAQNYVFDASGNLVRMQSSDYKLSERGTSGPPSYTNNGPVPYTGTPGGLPTSPLTAATVSFSGGTTPDSNYNDTVNGIRMGRYAGGTITTTDFSTPSAPLSYFTPLGSNSLIWALREIPASVPLTGSVEYTTAYATKPTDSLGNAGTLNYASLSANFTTQTVNPAVGITINNQNLSSVATNVPIDSTFGFNVSSNSAQNTSGGSVHITCFGSNCAPAPVGSNANASGYGARFQGGLAGASAAGGAFFRYDFNTRYDPAIAAGSTGGIPVGQTRPVNDYINGLVAFTKGTDVAALAPATPTSGDQLITTAHFPSPTVNQSSTQNYSPSATSYTSAFGTGSPNTVTDYDPTNSTPHSETLTGATVTQTPTNANTVAATGISFGRYSGGTLSGTDWQGNPFSFANSGNYAWIKGPATPLLTEAMFGTAKYVLDGGTLPTKTGGSTGTINSNSLLAVNFNTSSVGVDLSVTVPGTTSTTWTATTTSSGTLTGNPATTLRLDGGNFSGSSWQTFNNPNLHQNLYVELNGGAPNASNVSGAIDGQLMGANMSGAGLTYAFQDNVTGTGVNGAAAFALSSFTSSSGTTTGTSAIDLNNVAYAIGLTAVGLNADPFAIPANAPASVEPGKYLTQVEGGINAASRLVLGSSGLPTVWDGQLPITTPAGTGCSSCTANVNNVPARFSIDPASFSSTTSSTLVVLPSGKTPATVSESGFDPATGIKWGRYGGGVVAVFDRISGLPLKAADVSKQNWHFIMSPTMTGPTMLPVTGTYTYTNVGGTKPTDNLGSAAGSLNAATLVADFAAQTVNAGVNLSVNGQTWAAGGSAIPIQQRQFFEASHGASGGGNLNVCVGATCGTTTLPTASTANTSGKIVGAFTGTSGQGLGMAYSLNQGGGGSGTAFVPGTTVSGVAAFKR